MKNLNRLRYMSLCKPGVFITARLKSTRLPMKAIKPILGKPMIERMIDRLKVCSVKPIVLMTSTNPQDDPLVEIAQRSQIEYFRGSEDDVLVRMRDCADRFDTDLIISVAADNPLIEPAFIKKMIERYHAAKFDFCEIEGAPIGCGKGLYAVSRKALEQICGLKNSSDTEIWGPYFRENKNQFFCDIIKINDPKIKRPEYRLTVDTKEDFELVKKIFGILSKKKEYFDIYDICELLDENKDLVKMNVHIRQKEPPKITMKKANFQTL